MEEKRYITMRHFDLKKKVVPLENLEDCLLWFDEQKKVNEKMVRDIPQNNQANLLHRYTCLEQKSRQNDLVYLSHMEEMKRTEVFDHPFNHNALTTTYNQLLDENIKNLTALKTFLEISLLENPILEFSHIVNQVSTSITNDISDCYHGNEKKSMSNSHSMTEHSNMLSSGMMRSWEWVEKMVMCVAIHVKHASKHCQFHAKLYGLLRSLKQECCHVMPSNQSDNDSCSSAFRLAEALRVKTCRLKELSREVREAGMEALQLVPVKLRTQHSHQPIPAVIVCDYVTPEVSLKEGDEVEVVDRSNLYKWSVIVKERKMNGGLGKDEKELDESVTPDIPVSIPSILLVVAGSDPDLQESIDLMYMEHERMVRECRREMEGRFLSCMMQIFKRKYTHVEKLLIETLNPGAKRDLSNFLSSLEKAVDEVRQPELACEVNDLRTRIDYLMELLEENFDLQKDPQENGIGGRVLIVQLNTLRLLLENFKDFSETCGENLEDTLKMKRAGAGAYKSVYSYNRPQSVRAQEDMVSVESVIKRLDHIIARSGADAMQVKYSEERLRGMSDEQFLEHIRDLSNFVDDFEKHQLEEENEKLELNYADDEEMNEMIDELLVGKDGADVADGKMLEEDEDEGEGVKISETEHMYAAESEEDKRFVITAVIDPVSKNEISLAEALKRKVVDAKKGTFLVDADEMVKISIAEAMAKDLIKVQSTEVKRSCERKLSVGVVTIKSTHHASKQSKKSMNDEKVVLCVQELKGGRQLSWQQAIEEGVIGKGTFVDTRDHSKHTLEQAELKGWIKRSRTPSPAPLSTNHIKPPDVIPEVKTTTYAVKGVLDRQSGRRMSFMEACKEGLIDKHHALYLDSLTSSKYPIEEAIVLGFVLAEQVADLKSIPLWQGVSWL